MANCSIIPMLSDEDKLTFTKEEKRELLRRFQQLEKENRDLKEEIRKLTDKIRKLESSPQMLSATDTTAKAGGVPSSKIC